MGCRLLLQIHLSENRRKVCKVALESKSQVCTNTPGHSEGPGRLANYTGQQESGTGRKKPMGQCWKSDVNGQFLTAMEVR